MKKFAFISLGLPPSQSGQSLAVYHLLREFDPEAYCLITLKNFHLYGCLGNCSEKLKAPLRFVYPEYQVVRGLVTVAAKLRLRFLLSILLRLRIYQYKRIIRANKCSVVVGCTGDLLDPPAAFFASRALNLPFILYAFDYYSRQWPDPFLRSFADEQEKTIVHEAAGIIVPNECLGKEFSRRYGVIPTVIHNPFDRSGYEKNIYALPDAGENSAEKTIVYTGAVYEAHYSAFRNLIEAIKSTGIPGLALHLYTPQSEAHLEMNGITGPVVIHRNLPNDRMPGIQRRADLLFLPLAFASEYPDIIRTSAPGKIGEYLASGTPVLVHAPKDSFVSWFFSRYQCGMVVNDDDPAPLSEALKILLSDCGLRETITRNACERAGSDFDARNAREKFENLVSALP